MPWLLLLYPFLVHAAIIADSRWLEWAALMLLVLNMLSVPLARQALWAWLALAVATAASSWLVLLGEGRFFLYVAPVLITLALAWLFGQTLRAGQEPLIARFARVMRNQPLSAEAQHYCLRVTQFWTLLLLSLALANLLLAVFAPPLWWSWFTNVISYLLLGVVFIGEWLFRRAWLGAEYAQRWPEYIRALIRIDYRRL